MRDALPVLSPDTPGWSPESPQHCRVSPHTPHPQVLAQTQGPAGQESPGPSEPPWELPLHTQKVPAGVHLCKQEESKKRGAEEVKIKSQMFRTLDMLQTLLQLLCLFIYPGSGSSVPASSPAPLVVNGAVGETQMLPLTLTAANVSSVFWYHGQEAIAAISPDNDGKLKVILLSKRKNRLTVNSSYSLLLKSLMVADAGSYRAKIDNGISSTSVNYTLRVFRRLQTLDVAHSVQRLENGTCELHLVCVLPGDAAGDDVSFSWKEAHGDTVGTDANLTRSWVPTESRGDEVTCTAENPISNVSSSISPSALCAVPGGADAHVTTWVLTVLVLVPVGLLLAICFYRWKTRLRGNFCVSTRQIANPATGQTPGNTEQLYTTAGNTVYAQVTHPTQETEVSAPTRHGESSTIYSTIQPRLESKPLPHGGRGSALDNVV